MGVNREDYYLSNEELQLLIDLNAFVEINGCRQTTLCDPKKLSKISKDNGTSQFSDEHIKQLWQLGFINADVVISECELKMEGLIFIKEEDDYFFYTDVRKLQHRV